MVELIHKCHQEERIENMEEAVTIQREYDLEHAEQFGVLAGKVGLLIRLVYAILGLLLGLIGKTVIF